jgi:hypothetical protein
MDTELLLELVPKPASIGMLINAASSSQVEFDGKAASAAAVALGQKLHVLNASTASEIDAAFATLAKEGAGALLLGYDPFFNSSTLQLFNSSTLVAIKSLCWRRAMPSPRAIRFASTPWPADELRNRSCQCVSPAGRLCWLSQENGWRSLRDGGESHRRWKLSTLISPQAFNENGWDAASWL